VINIINKNEIIVRHKSGETNREIAKKLGISKDTVNNYVKEYKQMMIKISAETDKTKIIIMQELICAKPARKSYVGNCHAFTPEVEQRFNELVNIDVERNKDLGKNKQQLTAALIHRTLISEGFKIGETTIRSRYRELKEKSKECFIKQHYEYGEIAQYDFHQVKVIVAGEMKIYHQATISIPKSNIVFGVLYKNEKMENFLDSLVQFFSFCKGVFKVIVFDNMRNVVRRFCFRNEKEYTEDLIKISNYYGFKIDTCNPRSGNEKGHVENSGKNVRRDMFCLNYKFDSEEDLYRYYESQLDKRNEPFMVEFSKEQQNLLTLPSHPYELGKLQKAKVDSYSLISIDGSFYSVPDKYVDKQVICNKYSRHLIVFDDKGNLIAKHTKKDGKGEFSLNLTHYVETLLRKPKALKNSFALKQAPEILQTIYNQYFSTKPKEFLQYLIETEAFDDDFYELGMEVGVIKKSKHRLTKEFFNGNRTSEIDKVSINQLSYTANLFGQEV
jgi:transposase/DNA-binding XRE family transcriptional regulator